MKYYNIQEAIFLKRPNRFIAHIQIEGKEEICHVKNTGRCKELLLPGAKIYVQKVDNHKRKTKYDLISVYKEENLVNIDSQAPNKIFHEWLKDGHLEEKIKLIKPEFTYRDSRFDFYVETNSNKILIETKGVTLEDDGVALFPDAPTERGIKHIETLIEATKDNFQAYLVFIVQMKGVNYFMPNIKTHAAFGAALAKAKTSQVKIMAMDCLVGKDEIKYDKLIPIKL